MIEFRLKFYSKKCSEILLTTGKKILTKCFETLPGSLAIDA
jgi:hypothetical protein